MKILRFKNSSNVFKVTELVKSQGSNPEPSDSKATHPAMLYCGAYLPWSFMLLSVKWKKSDFIQGLRFVCEEKQGIMKEVTQP